MVTKTLFKKYTSAQDWAKADVKQIESDIRSTGFYRNKAANIKGACTKVIEEFDGKIPSTMEEILTLPGVGRKTANCVLGNAYGVPGVVCDTHVIRLSPRKNWLLFSDLLIFHGRNICKARKPDCVNCPIAKYCLAANKPALW
jgi:endonuclease-3